MICPLLIAGLAGLLCMPLPAQTAAADEYDGCALVSAADVEAVIGEKLQRKPRPQRLTMLSVESYGCSGPSKYGSKQERTPRASRTEQVAEFLPPSLAMSKSRRTSGKAASTTNRAHEAALLRAVGG